MWARHAVEYLKFISQDVIDMQDIPIYSLGRPEQPANHRRLFRTLDAAMNPQPAPADDEIEFQFAPAVPKQQVWPDEPSTSVSTSEEWSTR
eukprot:8466196-Karenia_brevis.AAC.1